MPGEEADGKFRTPRGLNLVFLLMMSLGPPDMEDSKCSMGVKSMNPAATERRMLNTRILIEEPTRHKRVWLERSSSRLPTSYPRKDLRLMIQAAVITFQDAT